jgi:hypothetical protein
MRAWIDAGMQAHGREAGNRKHQSPSPRWGERVALCVANDLTGVGIREDDAGAGRKDVGREIRGDREQKRIAIFTVFGPLLIGAEIGNARFDFNDPDVSFASDRQNVRTPSVAKRDFAQAFKVKRPEETLRAAQQGASPLIIARWNGRRSRASSIRCGRRCIGHGAAIMAVRQLLASGRQR